MIARYYNMPIVAQCQVPALKKSDGSYAVSCGVREFILPALAIITFPEKQRSERPRLLLFAEKREKVINHYTPAWLL
jgi:hypothetical protein